MICAPGRADHHRARHPQGPGGAGSAHGAVRQPSRRHPVRQGTLTYQAGQIGEQLDSTAQSAMRGMDSVDTVAATIRSTRCLRWTACNAGSPGAVDGLNRVGAGSQDIGAGMTGLQGNLQQVSGYADPLRQFVNGNPGCAANPICAAVQKIVTPLDDAVSATGTLAGGAGALEEGAAGATDSLDGAAKGVATMRAALAQLRGLTSTLRSSLGTVGPQMQPDDRLPVTAQHRFRRQFGGRVPICRQGLSTIRNTAGRWR